METPPPADAHAPAEPPPERRCPRCGSNLSPDQEWCLSCGAAAGTEVVEARGWRVPLYLGGGLTLLAVLGVILAIVALASRKEEVAQNPTPQPSPSAAAPPAGTATPPPLETTTPVPSTTPGATPTVDPGGTASPSPDPTEDPSATPEPSPTEDPGTTTGAFPGWTGGDGYTIIIESNKTESGAEKVAQSAQDKGLSGIGILNSDEYSSLNGGYHVVFVGTYTSEKDAEDALDGVKSDFSDAYVRHIKQ